MARASEYDRLCSDALAAIRQLYPDAWTYDHTKFDPLVEMLWPSVEPAVCRVAVKAIQAKAFPNNRGSYFYGRQVGPAESAERLAGLARIVAGVITELRRPTAAAGSTGAVELSWHGPFALVEAGGLPLAVSQTVAGSPGIYLWTVEVPDGYLVNYVGKTDSSFAVRLRDEIKYARDGGDKYWDVARFARGERVPVPNPPNPSENIEQILALYRIFMAPVMAVSPSLEQIESHVIHHLRSCGGRCTEFLANKRPSCSAAVSIRQKAPPAVRLIGLDSDVIP